jgi:hypothetical protein
MTSMWSSPERRSEHCAGCAEEREFEQPPCVDGHDAPGECPEWICVACGYAIFVGVPDIPDKPLVNTSPRALVAA